MLETNQDDDEDNEKNTDNFSGEIDVDDDSTAPLITESDIENALQDCHSTREMLYADVAVNIAEDFAIFGDATVQIVLCQPSHFATGKQMELCLRWQELIQHGQGNNLEQTEKEIHGDNVGSVSATSLTKIPLPSNNNIRTVQRSVDVHTAKSNATLQNISSDLNQEQLMAYIIIRNTLFAHLAGQHHKQLLMFITGEGGTGKSRLLNAITELFVAHNCELQLARTAMSGVAACIVKGSTLHSWAGLPPQQMPRTDKWATHPRPDMAWRRHNNMDQKFLLAINEGSMLTTEQLTLLSQVGLSLRLQSFVHIITI